MLEGCTEELLMLESCTEELVTVVKWLDELSVEKAVDSVDDKSVNVAESAKVVDKVVDHVDGSEEVVESVVDVADVDESSGKLVSKNIVFVFYCSNVVLACLKLIKNKFLQTTFYF